MKSPWAPETTESEMVGFVVPPEDPKPPGPDREPLMTRKDMKAARKTLAHMYKILAIWSKENHTYFGGLDSLLFRTYPEFKKALDEVDRLWKRWGR